VSPRELWFLTKPDMKAVLHGKIMTLSFVIGERQIIIFFKPNILVILSAPEIELYNEDSFPEYL
jgi:hypothetical protein